MKANPGRNESNFRTQCPTKIWTASWKYGESYQLLILLKVFLFKKILLKAIRRRSLRQSEF